jgi:hypothetical protein
MNYSQFEYTTPPPQDGYSQTQANMDIKRNFRNVLNTKVGAEWTLPFAGARLRAGYAVYPSHLKDADSKKDRKVVSFGAGFLFMDQMVVDISAAMTSWNPDPYDVSIFDSPYSIQEKIKSNLFRSLISCNGFKSSISGKWGSEQPHFFMARIRRYLLFLNIGIKYLHFCQYFAIFAGFRIPDRMHEEEANSWVKRTAIFTSSDSSNPLQSNRSRTCWMPWPEKASISANPPSQRT